MRFLGVFATAGQPGIRGVDAFTGVLPHESLGDIVGVDGVGFGDDGALGRLDVAFGHGLARVLSARKGEQERREEKREEESGWKQNRGKESRNGPSVEGTSELWS